MAEFTSGSGAGGSAGMRPGVRPFIGGASRDDLSVPRPVLVRRTPLGGARSPYSAPALSILTPGQFSLAPLAALGALATDAAGGSEAPAGRADPECRSDALAEPSLPSALDVGQLREPVVALGGPDVIRDTQAPIAADQIPDVLAAGEAVSEDEDAEAIIWGEPVEEPEPAAPGAPPEFFGMTGAWPAIDTDQVGEAEPRGEEVDGESTHWEVPHDQYEDSSEQSFDVALGASPAASPAEEYDAPYDPDIYYATADDESPSRSRRGWGDEQAAAATPSPVPRAYIAAPDGLDSEPGEVQSSVAEGEPSTAPGTGQGVAARDAVAEILVGIADRVRRGEIVVASDPGVSPQLVLARVLASLLASSS